MSNQQEFNEWFEAQKAKGLTGLRVSLPLFSQMTPEMREKIRQDILDSEQAIREGRLRQPSTAKNDVDPAVLKVLEASRIANPAEYSDMASRPSGHHPCDFHHADKEILEYLEEQIDKDPDMSEGHRTTIHLLANRIGMHYGVINYPRLPEEGRFNEIKSVMAFVKDTIDEAMKDTISKYAGITE